MQAGDFWRTWDGERWYFGRCRSNDDYGLTIQWFGYGNRRCHYPYATSSKFIANFIAAVEII